MGGAMGFFDKLKQAADKAADAANGAIDKAGKGDFWAKVSDVAEQFADAAKDAAKDIKEAARQADIESQFKRGTKAGQGTYWAEAVMPDSIPRDRGSNEYFVSIIRANMPDVGIREWVSPREFVPGIDPYHETISLLLYRLGQPVLAILLVPKEQYDNRPIRTTMAACEAACIPPMRFMQEFENRPEYVVGRIRAAIG